MNLIMKKLKLLTAVVILAMSSTLASAQIAFAIKGGANLSNFYSDELSDKNTKVGFHVGLQADYEFTPNMAIQPGLFFTTKGSKITTEYQEKEGEFSQNLMYLQLPVHFAYKQDITPGTRIVFHAGPYVAYGVGGKSKVTAGSITLESDKVFGDGLLQYKSFDAGLGLGIGGEFGPFLIDLGWDMGLVDISNIDDGGVKNQNAYLSIGFRFD
jgi:hypothetical protein